VPNPDSHTAKKEAGNFRLCHKRKSPDSFDHLLGDGKQAGRHREPNGMRRASHKKSSGVGLPGARLTARLNLGFPERSIADQYLAKTGPSELVGNTHLSHHQGIRKFALKTGRGGKSAAKGEGVRDGANARH
jgi:hypothetical protein